MKPGKERELGPEGVTEDDVDTMTLPDPLELMGVEFKRTAIIGVGLIGGSIGLAIKKRGLAKEVVGVFRRRETLKKALKFMAIDRGFMNLRVSNLHPCNLLLLRHCCRTTA